MARVWRNDARAMLVLYLVAYAVNLVPVLTADTRIVPGLGGAHLLVPVLLQCAWLALNVLLIWRIWHNHGRMAWCLLLALIALSMLASMGTGLRWVSAEWPVLALTAVQGLLLLSPAVRRHVRPPRSELAVQD